MKRFILTEFALALVMIAIIAVMMYATWGFKGLIIYLLFAILCLTPAVLKVKSILKDENEREQL